MYSHKTGFPLYITMLVFLVWSCGDILNSDEYDIESIEAAPTMALPLAFGELSLQDMLNKKDSTFIQIDEDGLIYLEYSKTLKSQAVNDLIAIPDKENITNTLSVPMSGSVGPFPADENSTQSTDILSFDVTPEELVEVMLKAGEIAFDITVSPPNPEFRYAVIVSIDEFTSGGTTLTEEISGTGSIPLGGYLYATPVPNQITIHYTLVIKQNPDSYFIDPGTEVNISMSFRGLDYSYAKGYFHQQPADIPADTITIEAFGHSLLNNGEISFAAPEVSFTAVNDAGVPMRLLFTSLGALKPGGIIPIQIDPPNPVIDAPAVMGEEESTIIEVENEDEFMDLSPTKMFYKVTAYINEPVPLADNFISDTSSLKIKMDVKMPLYGYVTGLILPDTLKLNLSDADESNIESGAIKFTAINEMPLEADVQLYLADENYQILDSLITPAQPLLIKGSVVNAAGDLQSPGSADNLIPITAEKMNRMFEASYILINARMSSSKDTNGNFVPVKFRANQKLDVKLGLQVKLKINVKL